MAEAGRLQGRGSRMLGLLAVVWLVLLVRALGFEAVFQDGEVVFPPADAQYHLRRALYSYVNFPSILLWDPYLNYPAGASVPWPPLFDLLIASAGRLFAQDLYQFEVIAAWIPPLLASSIVIPLYLAGGCLGSRGIGFGAAILFAFWPVSHEYTAVGNADHHAAVAAIGAWLLTLSMALVDPSAEPRRRYGLGAGLAVARVAILLTWPGSLLYLALTEVVLLFSAAWFGDRRLAQVQSLGALFAAGCVAPVLLLSPTPLGGVYSSISLSWLHVLAMFGTALVAAWLSLFDVIFSERGAWKRIGWLALGAGAVALALLVLPGSRQGLMPAMEFLTLSDGVGVATGEQRSLFAIFGRSAEPEPTRLWGWFAYLLPLAALGPWLHSRGAGRARGERRAAYVLALWVVFFGALAVSQVRYGNDCSPAASLAFALLLAATGRGLASRVPGRRRFGSLALAAASLLGVIGIWPALNAVFLPQAQASLAALRGESWPRERAATSVAATLSRFMREVRLLTPRTSGYLEPGKTPEYGVIAHPNLGHALQFRARRPTAADPFWANIGAENWAYTSAFLNAPSEEAALAAAQRLKARYVVTAPTQDRGTVHAQLHFFDGAESGTRPRLEHFRLITESATAGRSIFSRRRPDPPGSIAYKLFEIVRGVVLVVHAEPGSFVTASLPLSTPTGRELVYRASAIADEAGVVRLRLPYPTKGTAPVHSRERYRIQVGARHYPIELSEWAIRKGESVQLDATQ